MSSHADLSPSAAKQWLNCTPSVRASEYIPKSDSEFAIEGTLAHKLAEIMLKSHLGIISEIFFENELIKIKADPIFRSNMLSYVSSYVSFVLEEYYKNKALDESTTIELETLVDLSAYIPESFGSADVIIKTLDTIIVIDLKYGFGVAVEAEHNPQLMLYGLGAYLNNSLYYSKRDKVRMIINQPRLDSVSEYTITIEELLTWADEIKDKATQAYEGTGDFEAGSHCKFCALRGRCKARSELYLNLYKKAIMDEVSLSEVLTMKDEISNWLTHVYEDALQRMMLGEKLEGFKIVEGKSKRKYASKSEVEKRLLKEGYNQTDIFEEPKLIDITAMEGLLTKKRFKELLAGVVVKEPGKPVIAKVEDRREEIRVLDLFE
jgi:hypothetical protein